MHIFVSYRRSDSQHLAYLLADRLPRLQPDWQVWVDRSRMPAGASFPPELTNAVTAADAVLVLIGPNWASERLNDQHDVVRSELSAAAQAQRLVIPIVHSGGSVPDPSALPTSLRWLVERNALFWDNAFDLEKHLLEFVWEVSGRPSQLQALVLQVHRDYAARDLESMEATLQRLWGLYGHEPSSDTAECYRMLAVALVRADRPKEQRVWLARSIAAAYLSGARNTLAGCLLPLFFQLTQAHALNEAHDVLKEIERLVCHDDSPQPMAGMFARIVAEKRAYLMWLGEEWPDALVAYEAVAESAFDADPRGALKAKAGAALCRWHLGLQERAISETTEVLDTARHELWYDVAHNAERNLQAMADENPVFFAYEVV